MVTVTKVSLTLNQIIGADLFLGYHISNWNPRINYFLIGRYRYSNIFNINYSYSLIKKFSSIILDLLIKKSRIWIVNENFSSSFDRSKEFVNLSRLFQELFFYNDKWSKGLLSNFKYVLISEPAKFPHAIFVPNLQNNHFVVNEAFLTHIPSFSIIDSVDNPSNVFLPLPGNSKSINSLYFFYLLIAKLVLHSRYTASSSFLFSLYNKASAINCAIKRGLVISDGFRRTSKRKKSVRRLISNKAPLYVLRNLFLESYLSTMGKPFLLSEILIILRKSSNRNRLRLYSKIKLSIGSKKKGVAKLKFAFFRWGIIFTFFLNYFANIFKCSFLTRPLQLARKNSLTSEAIKTLLLITR